MCIIYYISGQFYKYKKFLPLLNVRTFNCCLDNEDISFTENLKNTTNKYDCK